MTDEHDLHDANVDAAWRAHMRETPPPALDDAIRAAAHRAVQSGPRSTQAPHRPRPRAWVPLAIAATLGAIAFGVAELAPHQGDTLRDTVSDAPVVAARKQDTPSVQPAQPAAEPSANAFGERAQRPAESTPRAREEAPAPPSAPTEAKQEPAPHTSPAETKPQDSRARAAPPARLEQRKHAESRAMTAPPPPQAALDRQAFPAAPPAEKRAPPPPAATPAPAPPVKDTESTPRDIDAGGKLQKEAAADKFAASPPPSRAAANAEAPTPLAAAPPSRDAMGQASGALRAETARAKVATNRTPDDYVREIRRLRTEGRDADAALALAAFRAAYDDADARLPDDLREWSRSVARP